MIPESEMDSFIQNGQYMKSTDRTCEMIAVDTMKNTTVLANANQLMWTEKMYVEDYHELFGEQPFIAQTGEIEEYDFIDQTWSGWEFEQGTSYGLILMRKARNNMLVIQITAQEKPDIYDTLLYFKPCTGD